MGTPKHYEKAPITEAIIDIRVSRPIDPDDTRFTESHAIDLPGYPNRKRLSQNTLGFEIGPRVSTSVATEDVGWIFSSPDEKQVVQFKRDGFTFSRLAPYESWEPFRDEAQRLWAVYREHIPPVDIARLAVRNINRIDIPFSGRIELKDYFRVIPEVPDDPMLLLGGFFMQLQCYQPDLESMAVINEGRVASPAEGELIAIILDIDLFRTLDVPRVENEVWSFFEKLRHRKNEVFEACITEKARSLFQ